MAKSEGFRQVVEARATGRLTGTDLFLFNEGTHYRLYERLGAHVEEEDGRRGTRFAVWAPNAQRVSVIGDFNGWNADSHPLSPRATSGIWEGFVPRVGRGALYKYRIVGIGGVGVDKTDPYGFHQEIPPKAASVVWDLDYRWGDGEWMEARGTRQTVVAPMSIYEVHLGSWRKLPEEGNRSLSYREMADRLPGYAAGMGFTHVELLPVMEHPYYGSWGYQTTGYFAPTSRYGTPQDLMHLIDRLHQSGVGVILDWVPSHFATDEHGLGLFDGTHLYEHADPRQGFHPDWGSLVFNYGRTEVPEFLISSAIFWLDRYHADGLRVDAVASMLYLDYSRQKGDWIPNRYGGNENLGALDFLRRLNEEVYRAHPDVQTFAEESTAWPMVSRPTDVGGLGFGFKWDLGWMHDTLGYLSHDPVHRRFHHDEITFRMIYAFDENFVLPLSHDEVVHGKGSLLGKMPGDDWQRFANLRTLFAYMYAQPGKKLLFMGSELGQWEEWSHDSGLDWDLADADRHREVRLLVADLNRFYREEAALHRGDCDPAGFEWIDAGDRDAGVLTFLRHAAGSPSVLVACNFTPVPRPGYRIGVPGAGSWRTALDSDAARYGGSDQGTHDLVSADPDPAHGRDWSLSLTLPSLGVLFMKEGE